MSLLFHFSEDAHIATFKPRAPLRKPIRRAGQSWLNDPLVWAIDEPHQMLYLFPRDCPRILLWATDQTTTADEDNHLRGRTAVAFIEEGWRDRFARAQIVRYQLPNTGFVSLEDAGMHVSRNAATPIKHEVLTDLSDALAGQDVELRVVPSLRPLKPLWNTSLHVSGIRLRNAVGFEP